LFRVPSQQEIAIKKKIISCEDYNRKKAFTSQKTVPASRDILSVTKTELDTKSLLVELEELREQLEACSAGDDACGLLARLEIISQLPITLAVLQSCKIGLLVNKLRKESADSRVVEVATGLVKRWKKLVTTSSSSSSSSCSSSSTSTSKSRDESGSEKRLPSVKSKEEDKAEAELAVRQHCRSLLKTALEANSSLADSCRIPIPQLAQQIEHEIFQLFKETSQKYRSQVNTSVFFLYPAI
jgi:hypothetical protein